MYGFIWKGAVFDQLYLRVATENPGNPQLDHNILRVTDKLRPDPSFIQIHWQIQGLMECRIRVRTLALA